MKRGRKANRQAKRGRSVKLARPASPSNKLLSSADKFHASLGFL